MSTPRKTDPRRGGRNHWSDVERAILESNFEKPLGEVVALMRAVGSTRTHSAIDSKCYDMRRSLGKQKRRPSVHAFPSAGWPRTPPPEEADRIFLRTVVAAMRAEGLIMKGRAA